MAFDYDMLTQTVKMPDHLVGFTTSIATPMFFIASRQHDLSLMSALPGLLKDIVEEREGFPQAEQAAFEKVAGHVAVPTGNNPALIGGMYRRHGMSSLGRMAPSPSGYRSEGSTGSSQGERYVSDGVHPISRAPFSFNPMSGAGRKKR